jgi:hypothetical protein
LASFGTLTADGENARSSGECYRCPGSSFPWRCWARSHSLIIDGADPVGAAAVEPIEALEVEQALRQRAWAKLVDAVEPSPLSEARPAGLLEAFEEAEELEEVPPTDPTQTYLNEIGTAKLLTAAQEVEIGKRIEAGQSELRLALTAVPVAVKTLLDLAARVQRRDSLGRLNPVPGDG